MFNFRPIFLSFPQIVNTGVKWPCQNRIVTKDQMEHILCIHVLLCSVLCTCTNSITFKSGQRYSRHYTHALLIHTISNYLWSVRIHRGLHVWSFSIWGVLVLLCLGASKVHCSCWDVHGELGSLFIENKNVRMYAMFYEGTLWIQLNVYPG